MTWFKNDNKITDGGNYRTSFVESMAVLQLLTTRFDDNGVYTCEAQNDAGSVSCSTTLTVKGQPWNDFLHLKMYHVVLDLSIARKRVFPQKEKKVFVQFAECNQQCNLSDSHIFF